MIGEYKDDFNLMNRVAEEEEVALLLNKPWTKGLVDGVLNSDCVLVLNIVFDFVGFWVSFFFF